MKNLIRTAGCFIEFEGKFLILRRAKHKTEPNTWGIPAGKVEGNDSDIDTVIRETFEETGHIAKKDQLACLGEFIYDFPDLLLSFPTFRLILNEPIVVNINPDEHSDWKWVTPEECYNMKGIIRGLQDLLERTGYIKKSVTQTFRSDGQA